MSVIKSFEDLVCWKEFIRFLDISQSSAAEVKSMLYLFSDLNYVESEKISDLHKQIDKTRKLTRGLMKYLKNQQTNKPTNQQINKLIN